MDKLLMLGTTPTSVELVQKAKARGIYTITTDYFDPQQSAAKLVSDEYWMISTADVDLLEQKCIEEGVTAVLTGLSEFNTERMAELCQRLNLPCWCTPESWNNVQKKHNFKRLCKECGVPVATDYYLSPIPTDEELAKIVYPVVVKPVDMHSNLGLSFCYCKEDLLQACETARSISPSKEIIIERMLHGREYTAYYALANKEASLLALVPEFSQPGYPSSCYSVMSSSTNHLHTYLSQFEPSIKYMLKTAGCHEGICWIQLFLDDDNQFYAIEMGYRLSGDMMSVPLQRLCNFDSLDWLLDISLGIHHPASLLPTSNILTRKACACSYVLWSKSSGTIQQIEGIEEVLQIPNLNVFYTHREGDNYRKYGYMLTFVFTANTYQEMIDIIAAINRTVALYDQNGENPLIYFTDFASLANVAEEGLAEQRETKWNY